MGLYRNKNKKNTGKTIRKERRGARKHETVNRAAAPKAGTEKIITADSTRVFHYFRQIAAIPHGSHHTKAISDYLAAFAQERGLSYVQDEANNVIIAKEASEGCESAQPIALQGHIDMVLASEPDKEIDLLQEPITIVEDGDWLRADGTTLGADNGIAVAIMLAILEDETAAHPYLECIFTSDEEVGLIGASAIDLSGLKSRRLLNLDSEDEGVFCAGCAGGAEVVCRMPLRWKTRRGKVLNVKVSGLRGGHSGSEIHIGSANANVLLARMLYGLFEEYPMRLIRIGGGDADNAIPTNAAASVLFPHAADAEKVETLFRGLAEEMEQEYKVTDPGMTWKAEWEEADGVKAASKKNTGNLLGYLMSVPNGVTHMSPVIRQMPQTSLNLGILRTDKEGVKLEFMVRSGVNSQASCLCDRLLCLTKGFGGEAAVRSSYPAWEYRQDSPFRDLCVSTYKELTGKDPGVEVIHAGLECGILAGKLEGLDCISAGPDLENVHTVKERMKISSVEKVWTFVRRLLEAASACEQPEETAPEEEQPEETVPAEDLD
ncbi:MAG: aminoacyl-histidine dipeptidase [Lachnospiraceae bacterium]|nr:aminoacyl-histidine dipeptidase [Lachnospiraceae bacterium]